MQCPACRKENDSASECSRCGCDLSSLLDIVAQAKRLVDLSGQLFKEGRFEESEEAALQSWGLHHTPDAARCGWVCGLARGDFQSARRWNSYLDGVQKGG